MFCAIKKTIWLVLLAASVIAFPYSTIQAQVEITRAAQVEPNTPAPPARDSADNIARLLANAETIYVWSRTVFVKQEVLESALFGREDFRQSGLRITKDGRAADLVITVRRANFTTEYPYDVVDQRTGLVVASGKVNSLFGTAAGKIAKGLMKQVKEARSARTREAGDSK